ncbi:hypothetical protein B0I21_10495 [Sphingobacterium paludis]|uniref:Uncharacterized protein n=1 Tax=Sphingobacterium paludis TaxID=1476465 RepID=A0A4R7CYU5_9SPHI|nr:hypothetical protein B0I21_10495 [Sphingobacterium paludis]
MNDYEELFILPIKYSVILLLYYFEMIFFKCYSGHLTFLVYFIKIYLYDSFCSITFI